MPAKLHNNYNPYQHAHTDTHIYTHAREQTALQNNPDFAPGGAVGVCEQETLLVSANRRPCWCHEKRGWIRDAGNEDRPK